MQFLIVILQSFTTWLIYCQFRQFCLILSVFLISSFSFARVLEKSAAPFFTEGHRQYLSLSVLGEVCSSFRSIRLEPACNPAFLGEKPDLAFSKNTKKGFLSKGYFAANIFFGDDYETLYKNRDVIQSENKLALAQSLLTEKKPIRFSGASSLWWRGESWTVFYQPLKLTYFSYTRNQAYPDLTIHAMQEQTAGVQWGGFVNSRLRTGLQIRLVDRKFVHEEFNVFEAIPQIDQYLSVRSQKAIFIEPGVAYELGSPQDEIEWKPTLTANLTNFGIFDKKYTDVPNQAVLDLGLSTAPPIGFGELELGLNYRVLSEIDGSRKIRLGGQYRLGLAGFLFGIDQDQWNLGVLSNYRSLSAGLTYQRKRLDGFDSQPSGDALYEDSGYVEFRVSL